MGIEEIGPNKSSEEFTQNNIADRFLVLSMLRYEDELYMGSTGQEIFKNNYNRLLQPHYIIQRIVLRKFGFNTSDTSLKEYRNIFKHYYHSSTEYDQEVINSVVYMRENKCIYYTAPVLKVGDSFPDCELYLLDGKTKCNLYNKLQDYKSCVVAAFSTS